MRRRGRRSRRSGRIRRWLPLLAVLVVLLPSAAAAFVVLRDGGDGGSVMLPPTATPMPASRTPTAAPGSPTPVPSTETPVPPTSTPVPPTEKPPVQWDPSDLLVPVSKRYALPAGYVPPNLVAVPGELWAPGFPSQTVRSAALDPLLAMLRDARAAGYDIRVRSSYRSYETQRETYQYWVSVVGEEEASRVSAKPGHSEHQLGTAVDVTSASVGWELTPAFGDTAEGRWIAAHSHEYGFALSYPAGKEPVTGYAYEPWHFRYIGREAAARWKASGLTLIEFLLSQ